MKLPKHAKPPPIKKSSPQKAASQQQTEPGQADLWFLPLGGTGEIGMNLNLYGHHQSWLMVDCGVSFQRDDPRQPDVFMADPHFILQRRQQLQGLILTHAHEDHLGAVAHLWPQLQCPVYATPFAAHVLRRKLREHRLLTRVPLHEVAPGQIVTCGPFRVQWMDITHSIPEAQALLIETGAGRIFHTGDWKLDADPVIGKPFAADQFSRLADLGIDAMVCDSTNAMEPGASHSEASLLAGLQVAVEAAKEAVIITTFASNLARLNTIAKIAAATGRQLCLLGLSMNNMLRAALETGYWDAPIRPVSPEQILHAPRSKRLIVAAGSQGDEGAALQRLTLGTNKHYSLVSGDTVIFSCRVIPGNEAQVAALVEQLEKQRMHIVIDPEQPIHASGHPATDELKQMYGWVKPKLVIPTHGTPAHIKANASIATQCQAQTLTGLNGDLFCIAPKIEVRRSFAKVGRLGDYGKGQLRPISC